MATIETLSPTILQQAEFWAKQAEFWAKQAQAPVIETVTQPVYEDDYDEDDEDDEEDYHDDYDEEDDETQEDTYEGYRYLENIIKSAQTQKLDIERLLADIVEREHELKLKLVSANEVESDKIMAELSFVVTELDRLIGEKARIEKILNFLATA